MAEEDNYPSDISTDERSFVPGSSLEIETGRGNDTVLYPPNNFPEVSHQNQVSSRQITNAPAAQQTSMVRTLSDSSESDTPDEVNTPTSRSQEELVTSQTSLGETNVRLNQRNYNSTDISRQLQNEPLQIKHSRLQIPGETASMENVLNVPDFLGYAGMRGPFIQQAEYPTFKNEENRFISFKNWPLQQPSPQQLTAAGLFYIGCNGTEDHDLVCCYRCGGTLREFEPGDNPKEEHRKWYPRCLETDWDC